MHENEPPETDTHDDAGDAPAFGITVPQERAVVGLLHENTVSSAARAAGVGKRTLHRWLREDPAFQAAYRAARRDAFGQAISLTQRFASTAVATLVRVMSDPSSPHTARVNAAVAMLRFAREGIELDDLAARLEELEKKIGQTPC